MNVSSGEFEYKMATLSVSSLWSFRDTEEVLVSAELREGRLVVQVEENLTAEHYGEDNSTRNVGH